MDAPHRLNPQNATPHRLTPHRLTEVLDALERLAAEQDHVALRDVLHQFGSRSYGPILIVLPMIDISPIGSIPGLPTLLALAIALTAVQMLAGRRHIWLPGFIGRRRVASAKVNKAAGKLRGLFGRLDRWFHGRLTGLTRGPFERIAAVAILLLCLLVPPLELIPLATTAPMAAIAAFGLALLVRDGALMLVALALSLGALGLALNVWLGSAG